MKILNLLAEIRATDFKSTDWFILDNLDKARAIKSAENTVVIENEHGSFFDVGALSDAELKIVAYELDIELKFDYVILTKQNEWLSFGEYTSKKDIEQEVKDLNRDDLVVYFAEELKKL